VEFIVIIAQIYRDGICGCRAAVIRKGNMYDEIYYNRTGKDLLTGKFYDRTFF
jgi:hypothetical protein